MFDPRLFSKVIQSPLGISASPSYPTLEVMWSTQDISIVTSSPAQNGKNTSFKRTSKMNAILPKKGKANFMQKRNSCWASSLGGCSDKVSREHTLTAALFEGQEEIFVQGFAWCKDQPKKVGIANITKKHLCTKHNNMLSKTDQSAVSLMKAFKGLAETKKDTAQQSTDIDIDGRLFERWILKTIINIATESGSPIGKNSNKPNVPSPLLVKQAFGLRPFAYRTGLYFMGEGSGNFNYSVRFTFEPTRSAENYISGTVVLFCGFRFCLLFDSPGMAVAKMKVNGLQPVPVGYHPPDLWIQVGNTKLRLLFKW
jgi:hypothetical protein